MQGSAIAILFLSCCLLGQADRPYTKGLYLDNGLDMGKFGEGEFCEDGSFVTDIEVMYEDSSLLDMDETAVNTVKLYCSTPEGVHTNYITSTVGEKGNWKGMQCCPDGGMMTGMRGKVMPKHGILADNKGLVNVEMECNHGANTVLAMPDEQGEEDWWSNWEKCGSGSSVCGILVRYMSPHIIEDDVAIADMTMYCCALEKATL